MSRYIAPHKRQEATRVVVECSSSVEPKSALDWLRMNQTASGAVIRRTGPETAPNVKGWMYRLDTETEGSNMNTERGQFDFKMSMFRESRGPPPEPVCGGGEGAVPEVYAYESWYSRVGRKLAEKWEADHAAAAPKGAKTAKKPTNSEPEREPVRRVIEISEHSGW